MADPNDKNSSEFDDLDDLFSSDSGTDAFGTDPFSSESEPELDVQASSTVSESNPFNQSDSLALSEVFPSETSVELDKGDGKKDKKAKKEKAPKAAKAPRAAKAPKEKKEKAPKVKAPKGEITDKGAARGVWCLLIVFLLFIVAGNAIAFMQAGAACLMFLIIFDVLGLLLLLVPFMMLKGLRKQPLSLFDTFLALAAAFAIVSCMFILAAQASSYGKAIKATLNTVESPVETMQC